MKVIMSSCIRPGTVPTSSKRLEYETDGFLWKVSGEAKSTNSSEIRSICQIARVSLTLDPSEDRLGNSSLEHSTDENRQIEAS